MESKIPLPTDNIFKFYALSALLIFISAFGAMLYQTEKTNNLIFSTYVEQATLNEQVKPSASVQAQKLMLEKKLELALADKQFFRWLLSLVAGAAFWAGVYGFIRWHRHVQPKLDEAQSIQIEIAKLNLVKLRLEVQGLQREGVGKL
jgi:hypothetical protein